MFASDSRVVQVLTSLEAKVSVQLKDKKEITVERNITGAAFYHVTQAIGQNTTLQTVDLSRYLSSDRITSSDAQIYQSIAHNILKQNKTLQTLVMDDATISDEAANQLAKELATTQIKNISMRFCQFESVAGIFLILDALVKNSNKPHLNLLGSIGFGVDIQRMKHYLHTLKEKLTVDLLTFALCHDTVQALETQHFLLETELDELGLNAIETLDQKSVAPAGVKQTITSPCRLQGRRNQPIPAVASNGVVTQKLTP